MAILSDKDIKKELESGNIICEPFVPKNVSNSSLDLRLGKNIKILKINSSYPCISFDINKQGKTKAQYMECNYIDTIIEEYFLQPNEFILAETLEYVGSNSNHIVAEVADKSTMARAGLSVCFSAGYIDAGNSLNITLEIKNNNSVPVKLVYGQHICQLKFHYLSSPCENAYDGKYKNSKQVEEAK